MPVESAQDRAVFLSADEFAVGAVYYRNGFPHPADATSLSGIFDAPHLMIEFGDSPISDRRPTFLCRTADLPCEAVGGDGGDRLTIDGDDTEYQVVDLQPDGSGMTRIILGK